MTVTTELMELAWQRCKRDIRDVYFLWLGMIVFFVIGAVFSVLVYARWGVMVIPTEVPGRPLSDIVLAALAAGYLSALSLLSVIAFFVSVFEFMYSYLTVCYYYNNCDWWVVNTVKQWWNTSIERQAKVTKRYQQELKSQVIRIYKRNGEL
jgi:hypothetical protein